ncbi:MAG: hypothetical protein K9L95_05510 [Candidatus Omnitrophica bacterium]|nr:hypothetical protein [Candidatus Omnitrophota bacterium]MCF7878902.1 hypothetical protein [Candidatus Omnitrophota bacterium]MCF7891824.1 hypothetical protein [Candidatus Omnitrophota bacterium]MCF7895578.1 hypothetical protein [Candidatus Omnitrophota bacterium]MCF7897202.1 hypothetical protein [Candidatus Omnitrophota bacterium]
MFKKIYQKWVRVGKKIATFQVRAIFTLVYFLVAIPYGLFFRLFARPFKSGWIDAKVYSSNLEDSRKQF